MTAVAVEQERSEKIQRAMLPNHKVYITRLECWLPRPLMELYPDLFNASNIYEPGTGSDSDSDSEDGDSYSTADLP